MEGEIMHMTSALGDASPGIQTGLTNMGKGAAKIASADAFKSQAAHITQLLVDLHNNRLQVEALAKVMTSVDATLGSLLDVIA
jgi:hypothetical protein